jgi:hypothetical protein
MSEQGEEPGSAARTAALHRAGRHIEDAGRLGHGVTLHVHQDEGRALVGRQSVQCVDELAMEVIAFGGSGSRLVRFEELFHALGVIDGGRPSGGRLTGAVQTGVHRDAVQPGCDGRLAPEGVGGPIGGDEGVLDRVSGLLAVAQGPQGHCPEAVAMPPHEFAEGVRIARDMPS